MLKVLKSGVDIPRDFKKPFAEIRHGNYHAFISLIGGDTGQQVVGRAGADPELHEQSFETDFAFLGLLKSEASMFAFHQKCKAQFGQVIDRDGIPFSVFQDLVIFELGQRMHAENEGIAGRGEDLSVVIDAVAKSKRMWRWEKKQMHRGRDFLNCVKHPHKLNKKFRSWQEGVSAFQKANKLLYKYELAIIQDIKPPRFFALKLALGNLRRRVYSILGTQPQS